MFNENTELSPQIQNRFAQMQQIQQQAQALAMQKSQTEIVIMETENALEELNKAGDDDVVYKAVGELLIRSNKKVLVSDLTDKKETLSLRLQSYERQEERITARSKELQEQLQSMLAGNSES